MKKTTKIWLIVAASLVLVGCVIFASVMTVLKWDFMKLSTNRYETKIHEMNGDFHGISVNTNTADILFAPSEDGKCSVVCYGPTDETYSVSVKENMLVIEVVDSRKWYAHIGINFKTPKITIYLPKTEYTSLLIKESTGDITIPSGFRFEGVDISLSTGDVIVSASASDRMRIKTSTGDICVENASAGALDLSASTGTVTVSNVACEGDLQIKVTTGKTKLTDVVCKNLISQGNTGDIFLNHVIAQEKFSIKRSTGDVKFNCSDAAKISVKTDTGDVRGSLLTDKVFVVHTDTGKVDVPKTTNGGICEIRTDTGDIKLTIE